MKRALIVILIVIGGLPFACEDPYVSYNTTPYEIDSIGVRAGKVVKESWYSSVNPSAMNEVIPSKSFGLEVFVAKTKDVIVASSYRPMFTNGFINSAIADPVPPPSESKIEWLEIFASDTIFTNDQKYAPGMSLSTLFSGELSYSQEVTTVDLLIKNMNNWSRDENIILRLTEQVASELTTTFIVKVLMEDGDLFEVESNLVSIVPSN